MSKFLTFQDELTPKGVHRLRISAIARPPKKAKSTIDLNDQCTAAVRETIKQNIGTTDFERLFKALVKDH